jgi:hypothetical protein
MYFCYIDESGGSEPSGSHVSATPLMVIAGLVIEQRRVEQLTRDYLRGKRRYFPRRGGARPSLGDILLEIKGGNVRTNLRAPSRNQRRQAIGFLGEVMRLLECHHARLLGKVWIKEAGQGLKPDATYTSAIQDIARHFEHFLAERNEKGVILCDGRMANQNAVVAHSIFTQKMRQEGDPYPCILELPMFGHSKNHVGLQIADLMASTLLFPMATRTYCASQWTGVHVDPHYDEVRRRFALRCGELEYKYTFGGRRTGGVTVSDRLGRQPSAALFKRPT